MRRRWATNIACRDCRYVAFKIRHFVDIDSIGFMFQSNFVRVISEPDRVDHPSVYWTLRRRSPLPSKRNTGSRPTYLAWFCRHATRSLTCSFSRLDPFFVREFSKFNKNKFILLSDSNYSSFYIYSQSCYSLCLTTIPALFPPIPTPSPRLDRRFLSAILYAPSFLCWL